MSNPIGGNDNNSHLEETYTVAFNRSHESDELSYSITKNSFGHSFTLSNEILNRPEILEIVQQAKTVLIEAETAHAKDTTTPLVSRKFSSGAVIVGKDSTRVRMTDRSGHVIEKTVMGDSATKLNLLMKNAIDKGLFAKIAPISPIVVGETTVKTNQTIRNVTVETKPTKAETVRVAKLKPPVLPRTSAKSQAQETERQTQREMQKHDIKEAHQHKEAAKKEAIKRDDIKRS